MARGWGSDLALEEGSDFLVGLDLFLVAADNSMSVARYPLIPANPAGSAPTKR